MFLSNPYLNYFVVIAGLLIIIGIISYFITKAKNKIIYDEIELFVREKGFNFEKVNNSNYNIVLSNDELKIYICLIKIPSNSSVTINSKTTWCLRFGGLRVGRNYPNKRYMNEITGFLKQDIEKNERKIIVLYPNTEKILKYVNESDLCLISSKDTPYGYKVVTYPNLYKDFDLLLSNISPK